MSRPAPGAPPKPDIVLLLFPSTGPVVLEPPFGLIYIGTTLKAAGFAVRIIDCRIEDLRKELRAVRRDFNILFAGLTAMTGPQVQYALRIAAFLRREGVGPIVWGGIHVSLLPEQSIESEHVDFILKGYSDRTAVEFAQALRDGGDLSKISGIVYKKDGAVVHNTAFPQVDLAGLPMPDWSLIDIRRYTNRDNPYTDQKAVYLFSSRGCPFSCTFCYGMPFHQGRWQARSAEQVLAELDSLARMTDYEVVFFHDDNFSIDKGRLRAVAGGLRARGKGFVLSANAASVDEDMIRLLVQSGCIRLDIAVESGSPEILRRYGKGFDLARADEVFALAARHRLPVLTSAIIGHPDETMADVNLTLDYIDHLVRDYPTMTVTDVKLLTPYPGTPVYDLALSRGFKPPQRLEQWGSYYWNTINLPWLRDKKVCLDLSFISLFTFRLQHLKSRSRAALLAYRLFHRTCAWRWRHRWFHLPVETRLMNLALLAHNRFSRSF